MENVLTPELLRRVAWNPPEPIAGSTIETQLLELGARQWQVDATAQVIAEAFVDADQTSEPSAEAQS
jgi:ribonuclease D